MMLGKEGGRERGRERGREGERKNFSLCARETTSDFGNCRLGYWLLLLVDIIYDTFHLPSYTCKSYLGELKMYVVAIHGATAASSKILFYANIFNKVMSFLFTSNENGNSFILDD